MTEEDLIEIAKSSQQQKNQRELKAQKRILKQAYDEQLARNFEPLTEKIEKVNETTTNLDPSFILFQIQIL